MGKRRSSGAGQSGSVTMVAGKLPKLYRKLHQAAARRQAGLAHHDAGCAADVPASEIRRARARGRGGQQTPLRLDRAAHPHDAARRDEGCGAGAHHPEKSDRERDCAEAELQTDAGAERAGAGHVSASCPKG